MFSSPPLFRRWRVFLGVLVLTLNNSPGLPSLICGQEGRNIFPFILTLLHLSYCRDSWNLLVTVKRHHWSTGGIRLRNVPWSNNHQVSYNIYGVLFRMLHGFFPYFQRSVNPAYSSHIDTLFGSTMAQADLPLQNNWFFQVPRPMSSAKGIRWSIENLSSLMLTLQKSWRSEPII